MRERPPRKSGSSDVVSQSGEQGGGERLYSGAVLEQRPEGARMAKIKPEQIPAGLRAAPTHLTVRHK